MDPNNPYQTYIRMLKKIENDDLDAIRAQITTELAISPQWLDIKKQLFYKAVIHNSHQIIIFTLITYPAVLSDDTVYNLQILRHAVRNRNLNLVKIILHNDFKLMIHVADFDMYDCIVQDAFRCYYQISEQSFRAKMIIKFLIEYPKHQSQQFGIQLFLDEATMEIDLTISEVDINKLHSQKTALEFYVDRMKIVDRKMVYLVQLFRNIVYCLVREIVRLKVCKFGISVPNERIIAFFKDLQCFAGKCEDEIFTMFGYSIIDHEGKISVKVSGLVAADNTLIEYYSFTERILAIVLTREFRSKFPIYCNTILRFVTAAFNRRNRVMLEAGPSPFL